MQTSGGALKPSGLIELNSGTLGISNLNSLKVEGTTADTGAKGGIVTRYNGDSVINIYDINDVSVNTAVDQGLHAMGGSINIYDVDNVTVSNSSGDAIYAQRPSANPTDAAGNMNGSISIKANNEVNISGKYGVGTGLAGNQVKADDKDASVNIEASKVNIKTEGVSVYMQDKDAYGNTGITITGTKKVNIESNAHAAIYSKRTTEGEANFNITSASGDVTISSNQHNAAYLNNTGTSKSNVNINAENGDVNISSNSTNGAKGVVHVVNSKTGKSDLNINAQKGNLNITGNVMPIWIQGNGQDTAASFGGKNVNINSTYDGYYATYLSKANLDINGENLKIGGTNGITNTDGTVNLTQTGANGTVAVGNLDISGANAAYNLSAEGDTSASTGAYIVKNSGTINFNKGEWDVNSWTGDKSGNLNLGDNAKLNVNTKIELDSFTAGANSVTSFDASKENAYISTNAAGNFDIDNTATALVYNAQRNTTYTLLAVNNNTENAINEFKIIKSGDNPLLSFKNLEDGSIVAAYDSAAVKSAMPDVVIPNVIGNNNIAAGSAMDKFIGKVGDLAASDKDKASDAVNSLANIGELGGTSHGTYTASNIMTDLVNEHLSLATHGDQDRDLWAYLIHNRENVDGMSLGGLDAVYDATYNGVIVGGEFYNKGKVSAGAAFSYMDGSIKGNTLTARTENDADYYGLSLYGKIDNGDSAVFGDISYLHGKNDITQTNMGEKITADPKSDAFSIGVRAEKSFEAGAGQLVPYIGARYMKLGVGDYKDSFGINYDADEQDLFMVPVGVSYSTEIKHNDWTVSPYAKAGYVWTFGDRETDQTVSLAGAADTFGFETADSGSFVGQLGINAENDAMSYGLGYSYQKGDSVQANKWMANVLFKF